MSRENNNTNIEFISEKPKIENKNLDDLNLSAAMLNPSSNPASPLLDKEYPLNDLNTSIELNAEPLIEPDDEKFNKPPLADNPEIDDFDDDRPISNKPEKGIDEGFFTPDVAKDGNELDAEEIDDLIKDVFDLSPRIGGEDVPDSSVPSEKPTIPPNNFGGGFPPSYPGGFPGYGAGLGPGVVVGEDGMITLPNGEIIPDVNVYQHKKTLAQGMMDLALFSANANQLRYVMESASNHPYYYPGIFMIALSLVLQIMVGVGLIWNSRYNVKDEKQICVANKINNFTVIGIFIVTVINVFISAFGVAKSS